MSYFNRSFCIFEAVATIQTGGTLIAHSMMGPASQHSCMFWRLKHLKKQGFVREDFRWDRAKSGRNLRFFPELACCRHATCRSDEDKRTINAFISNSIGFETADALIADRIIIGASHLNEGYWYESVGATF